MQLTTLLFLTITGTLALPSLSTPRIAALAGPYVPAALEDPAYINDKVDIPTLSKRQTPTNSTKPSATIKLCTAPDFGGECHQSTWPVNTCIDLRGYKGITESFGVVEGFECLVMQGACDAATGYVEVGDSGSEEIGEDLTEFSWIKNATSYMCFKELAEMRRFVLRAKAARLPIQI